MHYFYMITIYDIIQCDHIHRNVDYYFNFKITCLMGQLSSYNILVER